MRCNIWDKNARVYSRPGLPKTDPDYLTSPVEDTKLSKGKHQLESCQFTEWMASFYIPVRTS